MASKVSQYFLIQKYFLAYCPEPKSINKIDKYENDEIVFATKLPFINVSLLYSQCPHPLL
jgi:hypothetical protein